MYLLLTEEVEWETLQGYSLSDGYDGVDGISLKVRQAGSIEGNFNFGPPATL